METEWMFEDARLPALLDELAAASDAADAQPAARPSLWQRLRRRRPEKLADTPLEPVRRTIDDSRVAAALVQRGYWL